MTKAERIYKVYAQCCRAVKGITEITLEDAHELIAETVYSMVDMGDIEIEGEGDDFVSYYENIVDKAIKFFEENGFFECGDFIVKYSDEEPTRSGSYGWTKDFY